MKRLFTVIIFLLISLYTTAQINVLAFDTKNYPFKRWRAKTINKANTFQDIYFYRSEEKMIIFYCNLVRLNSRLFAKTFLDYYADSLNIKGPAYRSLKRKLRFTRRMKPLEPQKELQRIARNESISMGKTGETSTAGLDKYKRHLKQEYKMMGEAFEFGHNLALDIVIHMLLDKENPKHPNRDIILNRRYNSIGVAVEQHKTLKFNTVVVLGRL